MPSPPAVLPAAATRLRRTLLDWYDGAKRTLPWRAGPGVAADPWAVLVSEIMLQQTTVATVQARFGPFLARFPTPAAMAEAGLDDVLHAWQGLGYYRRARGLHACARAIVRDHAGRVPGEPVALAALPGIGPYTAAAVAAIAFGRQVVAVDGNVARVLARLTAHDRPLSATKAELWPLAADLAGGTRPGDLAQALMELGALVCMPRQPACATCPWAFACRAHAEGRAAALPVKSAKRPRPERRAVAMLIRDDCGRLCLRRRPEEGLLGGLIELPAVAPEALPPGEWQALAGTVRHVFTHFSLEVTIVTGRPAGALGDTFFHPPSRLHELALPTLTRKLLRHAGVEAPLTDQSG
ncbi:MAG: A/G-specific adenine glycosylase [Geminicoccaceae bacterium]